MHDELLLEARSKGRASGVEGVHTARDVGVAGRAPGREIEHDVDAGVDWRRSDSRRGVMPRVMARVDRGRLGRDEDWQRSDRLGGGRLVRDVEGGIRGLRGVDRGQAGGRMEALKLAEQPDREAHRVHDAEEEPRRREPNQDRHRGAHLPPGACRCVFAGRVSHGAG